MSGTMTSLVEPASESASPAAPPSRLIESLQEEILALHEELAVLRRRDETLNDHMHQLDEELRLASRLQRDFLPKNFPELGPVRFHVLFRPAGYVSGDIYDVIRLDENHVGFYVADAVGHGIPAALLTMFLKRALVTKEILPSGYRLLPPSESLAQLNQCLVDQGLAHTTFATALYGMINTRSLE
ncbi:MAG TPA: SpoIIE family protein phosphatase, partial [Tepidisphaeraceae bacterium]